MHLKRCLKPSTNILYMKGVVEKKCLISHERTAYSKMSKTRVYNQRNLWVPRSIKSVFGDGPCSRRRPEISSDKKY